MVLNDSQITRRAKLMDMIDPFVDRQVREVEVGGEKTRVVSYGLSSFGYDLRVGNKFKVFTNAHGHTVVDPKSFDSNAMVEREVSPHEPVVIPPNSFALGLSVERFRIPRDVVTVCLGKSTYARCGIVVNVTPFEPEWEGHVVLEISNTTPLPAKVYAYEGLAQVLFLRGEPCAVSYADRDGRYQNQERIVTAKI